MIDQEVTVVPPERTRVIQPVQAGDTIRMVQGTCSQEHRAPDGGVKFVPGLVVRVDDVHLDALTARRWVRNRIAEPFPGGRHGDIVTDEERTADTGDLQAQIDRLTALRDRVADLRANPPPPDPSVRPPRDPDLAIGTDPYRVPPGEDYLAGLGIADEIRERLLEAGFTRPDIVERATDEDILAIKGVGEGSLARLRGRRGPGRR